MDTDDRPRDSAAPGRTKPAGEPLWMTEGERRTAEWEARQHVAASHPSKPSGGSAARRSHIPSPEGLRQPRRRGFLRRVPSRGGAEGGRA